MEKHRINLSIDVDFEECVIDYMADNGLDFTLDPDHGDHFVNITMMELAQINKAMNDKHDFTLNLITDGKYLYLDGCGVNVSNYAH